MTTIPSDGTSNANALRTHFQSQITPPSSSPASIIIVGAGAFGSSVALELVTNYRETYPTVQVFDKWPVPSRDAASTDTTKIIRADYVEPIYAKIAGEAIDIWKTELFNGWILLNDENDTVCVKTLDTLRRNGLAEGVVEFKSGKEVTGMWEMFDGPMSGSVGYFNPSSGWANAAQATFRVASAAQKAGAIYHTGNEYEVTSLIYDSTQTAVIGVNTPAGPFHAEKVILCTGAWTNSLIDTKGQLVPKGHCLGHIQLTPEETARYANMPVFDDSKWNIYYFPPFEENGVMKIAGLSTGYITKNGHPRIQSDFPNDGIPKEAEEHLRRGMRASIPSLAEREMFDVRVCWCVDTPDLHFLITSHPEVKGVYLATGGSAHGFKFLPRIGYYIALMLEDRLPREFKEKWKWRPGMTWKEPEETQWTLVGKDFEETEGWEGSARHGVMAHTWGNPAM